MDIDEARRRLAANPPHGDPTAEPGETLDEKAARLRSELGVSDHVEIEFAVRMEHGEVVPRPTLDLAQRTASGVRSRGGTAVLISRIVVRSDWAEVKL